MNGRDSSSGIRRSIFRPGRKMNHRRKPDARRGSTGEAAVSRDRSGVSGFGRRQNSRGTLEAAAPARQERGQRSKAELPSTALDRERKSRMRPELDQMPGTWCSRRWKAAIASTTSVEDAVANRSRRIHRGFSSRCNDKGNRRFIGGLAGDVDPKKIDVYIEGLAGRRDGRLRLKIHRQVRSDGV